MYSDITDPKKSSFKKIKNKSKSLRFPNMNDIKFHIGRKKKSKQIEFIGDSLWNLLLQSMRSTISIA